MALVGSVCQGHYLTSTPVAFLKDGSEALFVPSKKQKEKVEITRALQIHKIAFTEETLCKLDKGTIYSPSQQVVKTIIHDMML